MAGAPPNTSPLYAFHFNAIGKPPTLLNRLSAPDPAAQGAIHSPSPSPVSSPKAPASNTVRSSSRKSLLEDLGGIESQDIQSMSVSQNTMRIEHDASRASRSSSSGTSSRQVPNGKASPASNGHPRPSHQMNGTHTPSPQPSAGEGHPALAVNPGPSSSRPALSSLLSVSSLSFPALSTISPGVPDQPSLQQQDALDGFRHAFERLQAESAEYLHRAEETRLAMSRQQDQATRWHARADALTEPLSALLTQCERKITLANQVVPEVRRLQEVVRQQEEEAAHKSRMLANLEVSKAELARTLDEQKSRAVERQRLADACTAELRQVAERTVAEKTDLEIKLREANARADAAERQQLTVSAERERRLVAQLAEQQRTAAQEKHVLFEQLQEQKRVAEMEKQKRMAGLVAEKHRLDSQLRAEQEEQRHVQQRIQGQQTQTSNGGPLIDECQASATNSSSGRAPHSQPPVAPAVSQKPTVQVPTIAPTTIPLHSSTKGPILPSQPPTSTPAARKRKPLSPSQKLEPVTSPHADRHIPPHMSPTIKAELATPILKTNKPQIAHASPHTPSPAQTPTARRVKPEPTTVGRKPTSIPSASPPAGLSVKPEASTPFIDRLARPDGPNNGHSVRREQSLDYVARPSSSNNATASTQSTGGAPPSTARPTTLSNSASGAVPLQPLSVTSRPPSAAQLTAKLHAVGNPPSAVPSGMTSAQSSSSQICLPDLAYPSREETPALMMTTLPSDDDPMGLGIMHPDDSGISPVAGQRSRGPTPPPAQGHPTRGRGRGRGTPVFVRQTAQSAQTVWEATHWSPTPNRPPLNRDRYSPPMRNKRAREDDGPPDRASRPRLSDSPPRNAIALPRRSSDQYEPSRSPYSRSRSRSYSPRDRSSSPRRNGYSPPSPRRYPRSPSPPMYDPSRGRGPMANGYAPPPPPPVIPAESEARLPQMVSARAVVANAHGGVPAVHSLAAPAPRARQRVAKPTAARGAPQGRAAPAPAPESLGKISLLDRLQPGQAEGVARTTPVKGKSTTLKAARGGGAARGLNLRGRGSNPARGRGAARGGAPLSLADRMDLT